MYLPPQLSGQSPDYSNGQPAPQPGQPIRPLQAMQNPYPGPLAAARLAPKLSEAEHQQALADALRASSQRDEESGTGQQVGPMGWAPALGKTFGTIVKKFQEKQQQEKADAARAQLGSAYSASIPQGTPLQGSGAMPQSSGGSGLLSLGGGMADSGVGSIF